MNRAYTLLQQQLASGKSRQQIAQDIGYSRPAVSLYLNGRYSAGVDKIEAEIIKVYDRRDCPHLGTPVDLTTCHKQALRPKPFGGRERLAWWETCQTCPHKPEGKKDDASRK